MSHSVKAMLELKGATVEIRKGDTVVVPGHQRSVYNFTPSPSLENQQYGVRIINWGKYPIKVAQLMSIYFSRSANSFRSVLQTLPYGSPMTLSREKMDELVTSLKTLGVSYTIMS